MSSAAERRKRILQLKKETSASDDQFPSELLKLTRSLDEQNSRHHSKQTKINEEAVPLTANQIEKERQKWDRIRMEAKERRHFGRQDEKDNDNDQDYQKDGSRRRLRDWDEDNWNVRRHSKKSRCHLGDESLGGRVDDTTKEDDKDKVDTRESQGRVRRSYGGWVGDREQDEPDRGRPGREGCEYKSVANRKSWRDPDDRLERRAKGKDGDLDRNRDKDGDKDKDRYRDKDKDRYRDREGDKDKDKDRDKDKDKDKDRGKDRDRDRDKDRYRDRDKDSSRAKMPVKDFSELEDGEFRDSKRKFVLAEQAASLSSLLRGQVRTNDRMDRDELVEAQLKLEDLEVKSGIKRRTKVVLMTEHLTGNYS